ncbi:helix-turn-helix transcriptional regulator [Patescibacteria group bacterium]|nr:helix-turn-helix transcriptional regulator [Patescibacteria group bacterium]
MPEDIYRHIGRRVREERAKRGWTQEQLAERIDAHVSFVGQLERGIKKPSLATIKKIAEAFGIKAGDILDEASPSKKPRSGERRFADLLHGYSHSQQDSLIRIFRQLARQLKKFPKK